MVTANEIDLTALKFEKRRSLKEERTKLGCSGKLIHTNTMLEAMKQYLKCKYKYTEERMALAEENFSPGPEGYDHGSDYLHGSKAS